MAFRSLGKLYNAMGDTANAEKWNEASDRLNKASHEAFYNEEDGYYFTKILDTAEEYKRFHLSQLANSLAICAGICPESELAARLTPEQHLPEGGKPI
jgi:GH15 family glucan-1,4-alpha-glucosidase